MVLYRAVGCKCSYIPLQEAAFHGQRFLEPTYKFNIRQWLIGGHVLFVAFGALVQTVPKLGKGGILTFLFGSVTVVALSTPAKAGAVIGLAGDGRRKT